MKHAVILIWVFAIAVVPAVVGAYDLESAYRSRGGYDYHKAASSRDGVYDINAARAERGAFEGVKPGTADVATNALPAVSESSLDWYRAAAARGSAEAQFCLGAIYEEGRLVPQDLSQAVAWYRQAAAQGNADAWIALAGLHDIGKGVPRNPAEADAAWRKAAELGNVAAQEGVLGAGKVVFEENDRAFTTWYENQIYGENLISYVIGMNVGEHVRKVRLLNGGPGEAAGD